MRLHGWGRYPVVDSEVSFPQTPEQCAALVHQAAPLIGRGKGRSYGDSSLAPRVLSTDHLDHLQAFNEQSGELTCSSGTTLDEILRVFVPRGWFLPVTPGTRHITVGGAIASDVHGKNHHLDGSFGQHVTRIQMLLGNGSLVTATPTEHADLFRATCGGMGLTGLILSASVKLKRIQASEIVETTVKTRDLDDTLQVFADNVQSTYSVAWIDCLARGRNMGRSLVMLGEHAPSGPLVMSLGQARTIPFDLPGALLNRGTAAAFNTLYYGRQQRRRHTRHIPFEPFFYPLDALSDWNRLYGRHGFVQYQFVLPTADGASGLRQVLARIAASGQGAFLAVLKAFGPANNHLLSFPREGYTLALDFKADAAVFRLLDELDDIVLAHGGRHYLAKDARMREATFKAGYPNWQAFEAVREHYHAVGAFASAQSRRLGLQ